MPTFLYAWELGAGLGHVHAFAPLLRALSAHHIQIVAGVHNPACTHPNFIQTHPSPRRFELEVSEPALGHADILYRHGGFVDASNLLATVRHWLALIEHSAAQAVVCDFAPAALLAARVARLPSVAFDTGFFTPPVSGELPCFVPTNPLAVRRLRALEAQVLATANAVLAHFDRPPLTRCAQLLQTDHTILAHHGALDVFARADRRSFTGPLWDEAVPVSDDKGPRDGTTPHLFVYLNGLYPGVRQALLYLQKTPWRITAYVANLPTNAELPRANPRFTLLTTPAHLPSLLPCVDAVMCHAGVGTINLALAHGQPLLMLPVFLEQQLNAKQVAAQGLGLIGQLGTTELPSVFAHFFTQHTRMTKACRAFAAQYPPGDTAAVAQRLVDFVQTNNPQPRAQASTKNPLAFADLDVIFLSYDEPNADAHFAALQKLAPHAQRVHGVKGFDAAHQAAAKAASTERFVTVDADTQVYPEFFQTCVDVPPHLAHSTWSWTSVQAVNGLCCGNGGVKIWHQDMIATLASHENASGVLAYDFCHHAGYRQFDQCFSSTHPNASARQAFRAGLREAIKLSGDGQGRPLSPALMARTLHTIKIRRLLIWLTVGADAPWGLWMMLGARTGFLLNMSANFDTTQISDYAWFEHYWRAQWSALEHTDITPALHRAGQRIRDEYQGTWLEEWGPERSLAFKHKLAAQRRVVGVFDGHGEAL